MSRQHANNGPGDISSSLLRDATDYASLKAVKPADRTLKFLRIATGTREQNTLLGKAFCR